MVQLPQRRILPRRISPVFAAVLDDAAPVSIEPHLLDLIHAREPGTCRWPFEDGTVRSWIEGSNDIRNLWVYGNDGAGKAVLAATLAEEMIQRAEAPSDGGEGDAVCFYLCRHDGAGSSDLDVFATLVLQLAVQSGAALKTLKAAVGDEDDAKALQKKMETKTVKELGQLLEDMARHLRKVSVFVVAIDGLEEDAKRSVLELLGTMSQTPGVPLRVALTGPTLSATDGRLCHEGRFHMVLATGMTEDIRKYVRGELARKTARGAPFLKDESVREGIEQDIVNRSHGAWLWAVCELEAQCNLARIGRWKPRPSGGASPDPLPQWAYGPDPEDVRAGLFPCGPYLESVLAEGNPRTLFILNRVLKYVLVSGLWEQARLSVEEMCETLTSLLNHNTCGTWYAENNVPAHRHHPAVTEQDIVQICGPLIRKSHDGTRFDVSHPSVIFFFRFYNPHLPETRDFLSADSPAKLMGQTVDEFGLVGEILEEQGMFDAAEAMHRRVMRCEQSGCGPTHPSTLARVNNLALFLIGQVRLDEAEELLLSVRDAFEAMDPPPTEMVVRDIMCNMYNMLGIVYKRRGELDLSEINYIAALSGWEDIYGPHSLEAARAAKNLGLLYVTMGPEREDETCALWERHVADLEASSSSSGLGAAAAAAAAAANEEEVVAAVYDLALLYKNLGRTGEAVPLMERAVGGYERLRGRADERTLGGLFQLGQLRAAHGEFVVAERLFREVVRGWERAHGREDGRTMEGREMLAMVQRDLYGLGREEG
ncbi:hypothetical protein JDV02_009631 [Purpureocillium takamizusanense]|uniref:Nephrocystin 3-like N-terminal domain-containing protein n=1 Tax=Purpureocillium takamizusanense TaxID=2060973 RepID=A0A9Q8VGI1_9HYPO|nr:uncharacterized protein JDV02_009631 [Purpureocillium takamizusanense]UNI23837.1 hypothetical protein JDV02_009631 [Purpureocillium takamizusanense]